MSTEMKAQIYCFLDLLAPVSPAEETAVDMLPGAPLSQTGTEVVWDQAVEGKQ